MNDNVKKWFKQQRRDLPWRQSRSAYRVWVSEIMLQQTQVQVVIPYFHKWMDLFPTVAILAAAPIETVLKCWEGLGYYSRARNLHEGAKLLVDQFGGKLTIDALDVVKGIGPYTKGAILNFAFHKRACAIDGNVMRVLSRYWNCDQPIDLARTKQEFTRKLEQLLPDEEPWIVSEGLIEIGALVCQKAQPKCEICPLRSDCLAYRHQCTASRPVKSKRITITQLRRQVAVVCCGQRLLVKRREKGKVMADLYEFPYAEEEETLKLDLPMKKLADLPDQKHTFTRYRVTLQPTLYRAFKQGDYEWKTKKELDALPFSSGHKRVLQSAIKMLEW